MAQPRTVRATPASANSVDVTSTLDKLVTSYHGFYASPQTPNIASWQHWGDSAPPATSETTLELFPDQIGLPNLAADTGLVDASGDAIGAFTSDQATDQHFASMQQYNIDGVALQRPVSVLGDATVVAWHNQVLDNCLKGAVTYGRGLYLSYDVSNSGGLASQVLAIEQDFTALLNQYNLINHPSYFQQGGRPVVMVWGTLGFDATTHITWQRLQQLCSFFKQQKCYVMIGVTGQWRNAPELQSYVQNVFPYVDLVQPWTVQFWNNAATLNYLLSTSVPNDLAYLKQYNIAYQLPIYPGYSAYNQGHDVKNQVPRLGGRFLYDAMRRVQQLGLSTFIVSFDNFDEATAIAKAAANSSTTPANRWYLSLDADGVPVSSDFYLRLAQAYNNAVQQSQTLPAYLPVSYASQDSTVLYGSLGNVTQSALLGQTLSPTLTSTFTGQLLTSWSQNQVAELVDRLYRATLFRVPDASGFTYFTNLITNQGVLGIAQMVVSQLTSQEFAVLQRKLNLKTDTFVDNIVVNLLRRRADTGELVLSRTEFNNVNNIAEFVVKHVMSTGYNSARYYTN